MPKALINELKMDPGFFVKLIRLAFKSEVEAEKTITSDDKNKAIVAYSLLNMFNSLPGFESGKVNKEYFLDWMVKALNGCKEVHRGVIGEQEVGRLLSYSPIGTDGVWPHEVVREFIEKNYTEDLERGFVIGKRNQRGVYTYTGGQAEREIAQEYYNYADKLRSRWPKCSAILRSIGDSYIYDAKRDEQEHHLLN